MSRPLKAEMLLPLSIAAAALALGASELMKTFELSTAGGDPIAGQLAGDRHGWAMLILAGFAAVALALAIASGRRAWAWTTAGCGIAALALFLAIDLPDANDVGDVAVSGGVATAAKAVPQPGFWLEAAATVVLALAGIAYATQSAEQRQAPKRFRAARRSRPRRPPSRRRPAGEEP